MARLAELPARLDDETLANVAKFAASPPPALPPTDETHLNQFMRMMTDMPRQGSDSATAKVKIANMQRHLGHLPRPCINWMMAQVHARFTFYPSIKELLDLASEWTRSDEAVQARVIAKRKVFDERQARMTDLRRMLKQQQVTQDVIDALDADVADVLACEGLLHRCSGGCGTFTQRPGWRRYQELVAIDDIAAQHGGFPASGERNAA